MKLFSPEPDRKRTVLLFVLRDKTKTPLPKLIEVLEADLDRMWDSIAKPQTYQGSKMTDFFEVRSLDWWIRTWVPDAKHAQPIWVGFVLSKSTGRSVGDATKVTPKPRAKLVTGDAMLPGPSRH